MFVYFHFWTTSKTHAIELLLKIHCVALLVAPFFCFQSPPSRLVALVSGHHTMAATFSGCATSLGEGRRGDGLRGSVGVGMGFRVRVALHSACAMVSVPRMPSRTRSDCPKTKKIKAIEPQPALKLYRLYRLYRLSASDGHQP